MGRTRHRASVTPSAGRHLPGADAGHHQTRTAHIKVENTGIIPQQAKLRLRLGRMFPVSTDCTMPGIWLTA